MSRNYVLRPFAVYPAALFLLLLTPFLLSCDGGGGGDGDAGGDGSGNDADPDSAEALFEKQNSVAINLFREVALIHDMIVKSEEDFSSIDPTDLAATEAFIEKADEDLSPRGRDLNEEWDSILQLEQIFQNISTAEVVNLSMGTLKPQAEPVTLASACLIGLTTYSWTKTLFDIRRTFREERARCYDDYRRRIAAELARSDWDWLSERQQDLVYWEEWRDYERCVDKAREDAVWAIASGKLAVAASVLGPVLVPNWDNGKVAIQAVSGFADLANIWVLGVWPAADPQSLSPYATNNVHDYFVARTLGNGEFYAPVGEWNITAFKDGYIRFGTSDAQRIVVRENQTTSVVANPTLVSEGEAFRQTCQTGGVPNDNGATAGNFRLLFYVNFDGSVGTDLARADIKLSGSASFPSISWNRGDVVAIIVHDERSETWLYGLSAGDDPDTGERVPLAPPLQYGDYSRPNTSRIAGYASVSPAMSPGAHYVITLGIEDASSYAQLVFSVE